MQRDLVFAGALGHDIAVDGLPEIVDLAVKQLADGRQILIDHNAETHKLGTDQFLPLGSLGMPSPAVFIAIQQKEEKLRQLALSAVLDRIGEAFGLEPPAVN